MIPDPLGFNQEDQKLKVGRGRGSWVGLGTRGLGTWGPGDAGTWDSVTWDAWGPEDVVNKQHLDFALNL